jgi:hypothetical protein
LLKSKKPNQSPYAPACAWIIAGAGGFARFDRDHKRERGHAMEYRYVGKVTRFFDRLRVAVIALEDAVYLEDWLLFEGPRTELEQQVISMQINHAPVEVGNPGEEVAFKLDDVVRVGDEVFLIVETAE